MILCIETATNICSVSLCHNSNVISIRESREDKSHSSTLTVFIKEILKENKITPDVLDAVSVSKGPGSYTGLRIGISVAKGIAYASGLPLIAISTLFSMYHGIRTLTDFDYYCPMIDARRMEVYSAVYDRNGTGIKQISAEVIEKGIYDDILSMGRVLFFGNGAGKCRGIIDHDNAVIKDDFSLSAEYLCAPSLEALNKEEFVDLAYFEPYYLKDFIATVPKKNIPGITGFNK